MDNNENNSFNLTGKRDQWSQNLSGIEASTFTWQERAYERLKVLYGVSKLLSSSEPVETVFPKILTLCGTAFPLLTAVLIEKRQDTTQVEIWHTDKASPEQIKQAVLNARRTFVYLSGASLTESSEIRSSTASAFRLENVTGAEEGSSVFDRNYVALPLVLDRLPSFGVFQLEGSSALDERDLEFANALAALVSVAVERSYRLLDQQDLQDLKNTESSAKLSHSQSHVADLELERSLRESFVSMLSHDLRTPLAAAKLSAQLVQKDSAVSEETRFLTSRIVENIARADSMIMDLLDANRIRSGEKLPLNLETFDMALLAKRTIEELSVTHGPRFLLRCEEGILGMWDRNSIRRIFENLCNNAVKYGSPHAPIVVTIKVIHDLVQLEVQNQGELIRPEDQRALFQQFRRGPTAPAAGRMGWGIGLTLVRGVAEAHGGAVKLASELKTGTVFTISLPLDCSKRFDAPPYS